MFDVGTLLDFQRTANCRVQLLSSSPFYHGLRLPRSIVALPTLIDCQKACQKLEILTEPIEITVVVRNGYGSRHRQSGCVNHRHIIHRSIATLPTII